MAQGFLVCVVPDAHIHYLKQHQGFVHDYLDGTKPAGSIVADAKGNVTVKLNASAVSRQRLPELQSLLAKFISESGSH